MIITLRFDGDADEGRYDACAGAERARQAARDLRPAAAATAVVDRDFQNAQPRARGAHLHLDVPAVAELAHSQREQGVAPNGAEGAHVGIAHAIEKSHAEAGEAAGGELMPRDASGCAAPARTRPDREIVATGAD